MRRPQSSVKSLVSKELVGLFNSRFSQVEDVEVAENLIQRLALFFHELF